MIVIGGSTKALNQTRNLYLACLLLIFGLAACSDSEPTATPTSTATPAAQQTGLLAPQSSQLDVDQPSALGSTTVMANKESSEPSEMVASRAATDLDQSILRSLSKFSQTQELSIEASSVRELELLSEADRQSLQAIAAQQTMTAAEQLAADDAAQKTSNYGVQ
jgi:hypothetical protein